MQDTPELPAAIQPALPKMIPASLLVTLTLLLALTGNVAANPVIINRSPVTLPLLRVLNLTSTHNLLRYDQARAKALKSRGSSLKTGKDHDARAVINEPVDNQAVAYIASIGVGSPPTTCK